MEKDRKKIILRGSLTVEAALIVPMVIMMLFALICLMLASQQKAVLQARTDAEAELEVMAMDGTEPDGETGPAVRAVYDALRSQKRSHKSAGEVMRLPHGGIRRLTGGDFTLEASAAAVRVVYVDDWLKAHVIERLRTED